MDCMANGVYSSTWGRSRSYPKNVPLPPIFSLVNSDTVSAFVMLNEFSIELLHIHNSLIRVIRNDKAKKKIIRETQT